MHFYGRPSRNSTPELKDRVLSRVLTTELARVLAVLKVLKYNHEWAPLLL